MDNAYCVPSEIIIVALMIVERRIQIPLIQNQNDRKTKTSICSSFGFPGLLECICLSFDG